MSFLSDQPPLIYDSILVLHLLLDSNYLVTICKQICFHFLRRPVWTFSLAPLRKIVFTAAWTRTRLKLSSRSAPTKVSSRSARTKARTLPRHQSAYRLAPTQPAQKNLLRSFMKMDSQRGAGDEADQDYLFHFHPPD